MTYYPQIHHRRSIRLREYDYSWVGWYYVTICTNLGKCTLGNMNAEILRLSKSGEIVQTQWRDIPRHFPSVELDDFVVMPNHLHGIIILGETRRGEVTSPLRRLTLGKVIAYFKYQSTKAINEERGTPAAKAWQRNYYEHIIRKDADLHRIRAYIRNNPLKWAPDKGNPNSHIGADG